MPRLTQYCTDYENIENYDAAKKDNFKGWCIHHRKQTYNSDGERLLVDISAEELNALGLYWHRPAEELIFIKTSEHTSLHQKGKHRSDEARKKMSEAAKGKPKSEEHKRNISEGQKGEKNHNYGKHFSEETKKKIGAASKGRNIGKHWYHNDKENFYCYECPPGCEQGMLKKK